MRNTNDVSWVVYQRPMKGTPTGTLAVCEQAEWEALDRDKPGFFTLIRAGITSEGEAERLARGTSGEARPRNSKLRMVSWPAERPNSPAAPDDPPASVKG